MLSKYMEGFKMRILIIIYDGCDDSETLYPYYRIIEEGWIADVASMEKRLIHAKYHFTLEATHTFAEIDFTVYDGLILPGGGAPEKIRQSKEAVSIVRSMMKAGKPIGAICHGQQILISADVLKNRRCTCYPGIVDDIVNSGALYEDAEVVVDDNLVTSRRPSDLPAFMREMIGLIQSKKLKE